MEIGIISCGGSNVTSVMNALNHIGFSPRLLTSPEQKTDFLIMPGVGSFGSAAVKMWQNGFFESIKNHIKSGKPMIGICLGMQLMFDASEESPTDKGLSIFHGSYEKLLPGNSPALRSPPNIGYNYVEFSEQTPRNFASLSGHYYFLHSFALKSCELKTDVKGITKFNQETFIPFILKDNFCGIQFHPERSGSLGLKLLSHSINSLIVED